MTRPTLARKSKETFVSSKDKPGAKPTAPTAPIQQATACQASGNLECPRDRLALTLRRVREQSGKSIYRLADDSGVEGSTIWRIEKGERKDLTRETLLLLSLGMVLNQNQVEQVIEVANEILDAAGLKMLRPPWENKSK